MLSQVERKQRYQQLGASLLTERSTFDAHWRDLGEYLMPTRTRFFHSERNKGHKRNDKIIDSTGRFAARTLQSGLHAGLTSPARPWFKLSTPDPDLAEFGPVKEWLHTVEQRMQTIYAQTNLYNALPMVYGDMGTFATSAMAVLKDRLDLFRCYSYPIGSYALSVDDRGRIGTFYREYEVTVRQVVQAFGMINGDPKNIDWSNISRRTKDLYDRGNYEAVVELCWMVTPNEWADSKKLLSKYLPFASCHYEKGATASSEVNSAGHKTGFLKESGYNTFPILAPRWDVISSEDSYGCDCPGMTALGDVKQLQLMQRKKAQALAKIVDPALQAPAQLRSQTISLLPGRVSYADARTENAGIRPIHEVRIDLNHWTLDMAETQFRIKRAYYEDLFLMLATRDQQPNIGGQPPTAREIAERHEEKLLVLGPVLERANDELLEPLVDRTYELMDEAGLIPPAPSELQGVDLKVEFISVLAQAQKSVAVSAQDRLLSTVGNMAEVFPGAIKKININRAVDNYGEMLGVDPRIIRSDEEADALMQQEAQAQQAQLEAENAKNLAAAAHSASQTQMSGDSALTRLMGGAAAAGTV